MDFNISLIDYLFSVFDFPLSDFLLLLFAWMVLQHSDLKYLFELTL